MSHVHRYTTIVERGARLYPHATSCRYVTVTRSRCDCGLLFDVATFHWPHATPPTTATGSAVPNRGEE